MLVCCRGCDNCCSDRFSKRKRKNHRQNNWFSSVRLRLVDRLSSVSRSKDSRKILQYLQLNDKISAEIIASFGWYIQQLLQPIIACHAFLFVEKWNAISSESPPIHLETAHDWNVQKKHLSKLNNEREIFVGWCCISFSKRNYIIWFFYSINSFLTQKSQCKRRIQLECWMILFGNLYVRVWIRKWYNIFNCALRQHSEYELTQKSTCMCSSCGLTFTHAAVQCIYK